MKTLKLVRFGIKNNRVLAGFMLLICGFIAPAFAFIVDAMYIERYIPLFGMFIAYFAGVLFPIVFFSYTHKRRESDFYAAMPVKKRQYFWGYFFAGIILFIIPFFIMCFIMLWLGGGRNDLDASAFVGPVASFFSIYCSMTLAVMFSGSTVSTVITFLLRNIFVISLVVPILFMAGVDLESYYIMLLDKAMVTAPLLSGAVFIETNTFCWVWGAQFFVGIAEIIIAFFLYKYRRSETTMALAFPKSRLPYQYIVLLMFVMTVNTVLLIVLGYNNGIFDYSAFSSSVRFRWDSGAIKTIVFFDVIAAFLMFILLNIVLERNSRAAFKGIRHLLFFFVSFFALAGLSGRLLNYIPRIYTPIEPDYAVVSVYRSVDPDSVDIESEEFEEAWANGEYRCSIFYIEDENNPEEYIRKINWLHQREEYFLVTSQKSLKELVRICEGEWTQYNIINSDVLEKGLSANWVDRYGWNYHHTVFDDKDKNEYVYFYIYLAKGSYTRADNSDENVCIGYYATKALGRNGYVIGKASGLEGYKDYDIELPEEMDEEYYDRLLATYVERYY